MKASKTASKPITYRLNHYFQYRSDRERHLFEGLRRTISLPTILQRKAAARAIQADATFQIDRDTGFLVFPPDSFPESRVIVEATRGMEENVDLTRKGLSKKARDGVMVPLLDKTTLTLDSPLIQFALRPDVIAAVSSYLGIVPVLTHVNVHYSSPATPEPKLSQLFHCDGEATSQVKIFVLCTEVTPASGPLTLLDAATSDAVRERVGYHYGDRLRDTDKRVTKLLAPEKCHPVIGVPGTMCFVDTARCFHFGSRVEREAGARLVAMIQYLPPACFELPRDHRQAAPFRHLATPAHTHAQQLVLGAI
jgi:hypothetical protein